MCPLLGYRSMYCYAGLIVAIAILLLSVGTTAHAAINEQIPFYGTLQNTSGTNLSGTYDMVFRFYDAASGGTLLDTSTHTAANGNAVTVSDGEFSVLLGSGTGNALDGIDFDSSSIYVGLTIGSDSEMTPRERLAAAPYAFNADTVDGYEANQLLRYNATGTISATSADTLLTITQSGAGDIFNVFDGGTEVFSILDGGNVGIGTSTPPRTLTVAGDVYVTGALYDNTNSAGTNGYVLQSNGSGFTWVATSTLGIGGGGSSLFTDGGTTTYLTSLTDNLGIGTSTAPQKLTVAGNINLDGDYGVYFDNIRKIYLDPYGNFLIGESAGSQLTSITTDNTAFGYQALMNASSTAVDNNVAIGYQAAKNIGSDSGVFLGYQTAQFGTDFDGIAIGFQAGQFATTSTSRNVTLGYRAGRYNTNDSNVIIGETAGYANAGFNSVMIGTDAGRNNTGGFSNYLIGYQAGLSNSGEYNSALGAYAGYANSGDYNFLTGFQAGVANSGSYNIMAGYDAGNSNSGDYNVFLGYEAGRLNSAGGPRNVMIGDQTGEMAQATTSTLVGAQAFNGGGVSTFTAVNNVALGYRAGYNADSGADNNILIGYQAADNLTTGSNNLLIGYDIDLPSASGDNQLVIGNLIYATGIDGTGTTVSSGSVGIGTSTPQAELAVIGDVRVGTSGSNGCVEGFDGSALTGVCSSDEALKTDITELTVTSPDVLSHLVRLTPVTYSWNERARTELQKNTNTTIVGLTAQDVEKQFPELVVVGDGGYKQVNFSALQFYIIQAIKDLWHYARTTRTKVTSLEEQVHSLNSQVQAKDSEINNLRERLNHVEGQLGVTYKSSQNNEGDAVEEASDDTEEPQETEDQNVTPETDETTENNDVSGAEEDADEEDSPDTEETTEEVENDEDEETSPDESDETEDEDTQNDETPA